MNCLLALLLAGCNTANLNDAIVSVTNPIQNTQSAISANVQKLRVPVSNTNAQINVVKSLPQNLESISQTWKY